MVRGTTLALALALTATGAVRSDDRTFERDILPLITRNCAGCHGPEEEKGKLDLTSYERALRGGKSGEVVVPRKSAESILIDRISRRDAKRMPPPKAGGPLGEDQVALIRAWIDAGAPRGEPAGKKGPGEGTKTAPDPGGTAPKATGDRHAGPSPITSVAFSPDGKVLALGSGPRVRLLDAGTGRDSAALGGHAGPVRALAWRQDGSVLAAAGGLAYREGEVILWRQPEGRQVGSLRGHKDAVYAVAWDPEGKRIVTASYDKLLKLWDAEAMTEALTLKDHIDAVFAVAFTPDGKQVLSASGDRGVKLWDAADGKRLLTFADATAGLWTLAVSPGGKEVAAAGQDRMLRIWRVGETPAAEASQSDVVPGALLKSSFAHDGAVLRIAYAADGKTIYTTAEDKLIKAWETEKLAERFVLEKQPDWVLDLSVRREDGALAVGRHDGSWAVYDGKSGAKLLDSERLAVAGRGQDEKKAKESAGKDPAAAGKAAAGDSSPSPRKRKKTELLVDVVDAGSVTVPPSLGGHSPRSAARGGKVVLTLEGKNLAGAEVAFYEAGFKTRVLKNEALPRPKFQRDLNSTAAQIVDLSVPHRLEVEVEIAADARPGHHRFLALTPGGATNALTFYVEHLAETPEAEPNDSPGQANDLAGGDRLGSRVIVGSMNRRGDADVFHFEATAGQEIVFHIVSQSIGSSLNGLLTVVGPDGAELTSSARPEFGNRAEARVAHRFEKAGTHHVRVTDKGFGEGGFYRLYSGEIPFVTSFFPPGLQRGTSAEVTVQGFNLGGGTQVKVSAPADAGWGATVPLPIPGALQGGNAAVGDSPEALETEPDASPAADGPAVAAAQRVTAPVTVNGMIDRRADGVDTDHYAFQAAKGQSFIIDVLASRIGSQLDSIIEVCDGQGRRIERATLRSVAQTVLTLSDRDSRSQGLRLESWTDLAINDHVMIGSEVLKVLLLPDYPDEDVTFTGHSGMRVGYLDTTPGFHAVGDNAYKVEAHPPGREFPPNGMPVFRLHYQNDDGGPPAHGRDSRIHFTAPAHGDYVVRVADAQGRGGPEFYYRLQVRAPRPDFQFFVGVENVNIPAGGRVPFTVSVNRLDDFNGAVEVELADELPPGFRIDTAPILPDQDAATLTVGAEAGAPSTPIDRTFRLRARAMVDGKELVREGRLRMLRRTASPPDLVIEMEPRELRLKPGGTVTVTARAKRQNGFEGRIPLDVPNLPPGVIVMDTGLNGILIPEQDDVRVYKLRAEPWVAPLRRRVYTLGRTETASPLPTQFASEPATLVIEAEDEIARRAF